MGSNEKMKPFTRLTPGGSLNKPFSLFTLAVSVASGLGYITLYMPEKDHRGNDHIFSSLKRWVEAKKDDFFTINSK